MTLRAVLDPNVIVSAALSRSGTPAELVRSWMAGGYELVVSPLLLDELGRVLSYPKIARRVSPNEASGLLNLLRYQAEFIGDPDGPPAIRSADPDDDYLICLARAANAVIVSGDSDLLDLADQIPVVSPAGFREMLDRV